ELVGYIIDGIPDRVMRNEARISGATTREALKTWFEQVKQWNKREETKSGEGRYQSRSRYKSDEAGMSKPGRNRGNEGGRSEQRRNNCFNCGLPDHVTRDYPMKTQEPKCFQYGECEHLASKCDKRARTVSDISIVTRNARKKYVKKISINGQKIEAFIDTESDICLMRADQHIRVGTPKLEKKMI
ncbi:hypothetical protein HN011_011546, partial [Eciton burchellii]